jgi:hypothetical protein
MKVVSSLVISASMLSSVASASVTLDWVTVGNACRHSFNRAGGDNAHAEKTSKALDALNEALKKSAHLELQKKIDE